MKTEIKSIAYRLRFKIARSWYGYSNLQCDILSILVLKDYNWETRRDDKTTLNSF